MANGMFGAVASGAASGAGMGAQLGSVVPGIGTAAGAIGGALIGGITGGAKEKSSQQAQQIPMVDPSERARLAQLEQTRKAISSGTDVLTQQNIQQQQNVGRAAQGALSRVTGGDVGSTVDALLKAQKATQGGINQSIAQTANRIPYFDSAQTGMLSRIAQRKLELARLNRDQRVAEAAQGRTDANINTQALLATQGGIQSIPEGIAQAGQQVMPFIQKTFGGQQPAVQQLGAPTMPLQTEMAQSIPEPLVNMGSPLAPVQTVQDPSLGQIFGVQSNIPMGASF